MSANIAEIHDGLLRLAERMKAPRVPSLREMNAYYIKAVVALHNGNRTQAAAALGITIETVSRWMKWTPKNTRGAM